MCHLYEKLMDVSSDYTTLSSYSNLSSFGPSSITATVHPEKPLENRISPSKSSASDDEWLWFSGSQSQGTLTQL